MLPTTRQPLSVDISTKISVECWATYRPTLDRYIGQYVDRHISVDISAKCRSMCRLAYWSSVGRYIGQYLGRVSIDMSTDISVEGCTKYTWSLNRLLKVSILFPYLLLNTVFLCKKSAMLRVEASFGDIRFPQRDQQRGEAVPHQIFLGVPPWVLWSCSLINTGQNFKFYPVVNCTFLCIVWTAMLAWGSTFLGSSKRGGLTCLGLALDGMVYP